MAFQCYFYMFVEQSLGMRTGVKHFYTRGSQPIDHNSQVGRNAHASGSRFL